MVLLGVILPLFGASVLIITSGEWLLGRKNKREQMERKYVGASSGASLQ